MCFLESTGGNKLTNPDYGKIGPWPWAGKKRWLIFNENMIYLTPNSLKQITNATNAFGLYRD